MNRTYFLAASTAFILWSVTPAPAAPKPESQTTEAKAMFQQIDEWSADVADSAFRLSEMAKNNRDPESHLEGLTVMREDINRIGSELQSLDTMRDALSAWEVKALDQTLPLMHQAADNAEKAIQTFNSDRPWLWASSYVDDTAQVFKETDQVASILRDYLKLAKTREKEERLEHSLGQASGF